MTKLRIERLGFGTGRQKMVLERWTNPKHSRRTCTCENGLQSVEGNRRASRNGRVSDLPPQLPHVTAFSSLYPCMHTCRSHLQRTNLTAVRTKRLRDGEKADAVGSHRRLNWPAGIIYHATRGRSRSRPSDTHPNCLPILLPNPPYLFRSLSLSLSLSL
jgi:hypothetical protein